MKKNPSLVGRIKQVHSLLWLFEPLEARSDLIQKKMFGCQAAYLGDRLVLVLADKEEPWNGILVPTDRDFHKLIQQDFPQLKPHPILGKWLYLSQSESSFEEVATQVVTSILTNDPRIGVDPKPKSKARRKKR